MAQAALAAQIQPADVRQAGSVRIREDSAGRRVVPFPEDRIRPAARPAPDARRGDGIGGRPAAPRDDAMGERPVPQRFPVQVRPDWVAAPDEWSRGWTVPSSLFMAQSLGQEGDDAIRVRHGAAEQGVAAYRATLSFTVAAQARPDQGILLGPEGTPREPLNILV